MLSREELIAENEKLKVQLKQARSFLKLQDYEIDLEVDKRLQPAKAAEYNRGLNNGLSSRFDARNIQHHIAGWVDETIRSRRHQLKQEISSVISKSDQFAVDQSIFNTPRVSVRNPTSYGRVPTDVIDICVYLPEVVTQLSISPLNIERFQRAEVFANHKGSVLPTGTKK